MTIINFPLDLILVTVILLGVARCDGPDDYPLTATLIVAMTTTFWVLGTLT